MSGWYLQEVSIEGFRGINNEGAPLVLRFKPDYVNSVSAPNGVGKTSIFDAVVYAVTGRIPKLDDLPVAEKGSSYYLNRFHSGGIGTVVLTLLSAHSGNVTAVTVSRDAAGKRSVTATHGSDGNAILADLNREFVLLDGKTFQNFIDFTPQTRGRSFAGLLGLKRYSALRQALSGLSNTKYFNNHFGTKDKEGARTVAKAAADRARVNIKEAYRVLVGDEYDPAEAESTMLASAHSALSGIALLKSLCDNRTFEQIDPTACVEAAKAVDGTEARAKLSKILQDHTNWTEALANVPTSDDGFRLIELAQARDVALQLTQGDVFQQLYALSETVLHDPDWENPYQCPTCEVVGEHSVLDHVRLKLAEFDAVAAASEVLAQFWTEKGWSTLGNLEKLARESTEPPLLEINKYGGHQGTLTGEQADVITKWIITLKSRGVAKLAELSRTKNEIEKGLPEKLTAVVEKAEAARRLQSNLMDFRRETAAYTNVCAEMARIARVKAFLESAHSAFATAEAAASSRRLAKVEPAAQNLFKEIMFEQVVPALKKKEGSEELSIALSKFWTLTDISAQAVLSESYRNAFAISVYLAAAAMYGGGAKFLILDDVTSSFDSGHQFHLMNVIKTRFARPGVPDGPQVILLSHDTVLEKLFNTNANEGGWWHQCIQGTARTSVLPQSGAVNRVRDATHEFLNTGNVSDAAPRIRQYLEFRLEEIINKVNIAVPIGIAFNDSKHMAQNLINAIKASVDLHRAADRLVMEKPQVAGVQTAVASITANYLSHWATGQTQGFSAGSLRGVMQAIDDFARCFQFEEPVGSGKYHYYKALDRKF